MFEKRGRINKPIILLSDPQITFWIEEIKNKSPYGFPTVTSLSTEVRRQKTRAKHRMVDKGGEGGEPKRK